MLQSKTDSPSSCTVSIVNPPPPLYASVTGQETPVMDFDQRDDSGRAHLVTSFDDHMCMAIVATLCCFWPLGVLAILKSSEARAALAVHDLTNARRLAEESRKKSNMAIAIGVVLMVVLIILMVVLVYANSATYAL